MTPVENCSRQYPGIDVMKFVLSFFVIAIHSDVAFWILNIAVPYFFIASGFFLGVFIFSHSTDENRGKISQWVKKIIRLYVIWSLVYFPLAVYNFSMEGCPVWKSVALYLRNFFLVGENYMSWPLWYLLGSIVAGGIIYIWAAKNWNWNTLLFMSFILFLAGKGISYIDTNVNVNVLSRAVDLYFKVFGTVRNGFFIGLFYMMMGITIARYSLHDILRPKLVLPVFVMSLCCGLLFRKFDAVPFASCSTFILSASFMSEYKPRYYIMRRQSLVIYLIHMLFIALLRLILSPEIDCIACFLITSVCSLIVSYLLVSHQKLSFLFGVGDKRIE